jgi:hypothetical protein
MLIIRKYENVAYFAQSMTMQDAGIQRSVNLSNLKCYAFTHDWRLSIRKTDISWWFQRVKVSSHQEHPLFESLRKIIFEIGNNSFSIDDRIFKRADTFLRNYFSIIIEIISHCLFYAFDGMDESIHSMTWLISQSNVCF